MEDKQDIGGSKISFPTFILKLLAGGGGGTIGALILLLIFVLAGSLLSPLTEGQLPDNYVSPIFIFILVVMTFLASSIGNILSTLLLALTEREKYKRISATIFQICFVSVIIFLLMVPIYFIAAAVNLSLIPYVIALHIIISAQLSALILEIVSNNKYALVGAYSVTFSIILSAGVIFGLSAVITSPAILLFLSLPVVWVMIALTYSVVTMIYSSVARVYEKDFLSTEENSS